MSMKLTKQAAAKLKQVMREAGYTRYYLAEHIVGPHHWWCLQLNDPKRPERDGFYPLERDVELDLDQVTIDYRDHHFFILPQA